MSLIKILSFDPGVNLGVAELTLSLEPPFEINYIASTLISYESELPINGRLDKLRATITEIINTKGVDLVAVEAVNRVFGGAKNANSDALYRIYGYIHEAAFSSNIRVVDMPIGTVKSVFADKGAAKKEQMVIAAQKLTGTQIKNHNEADAVGIGYTLAHLIQNSITNPKKGKAESEFRGSIRTLTKHLIQR